MHLLLGRCPKTKGVIVTQRFVGIRKIHNPKNNLGYDHMAVVFCEGVRKNARMND